jgi:hypothetical protein
MKPIEKPTGKGIAYCGCSIAISAEAEKLVAELDSFYQIMIAVVSVPTGNFKLFPKAIYQMIRMNGCLRRLETLREQKDKCQACNQSVDEGDCNVIRLNLDGEKIHEKIIGFYSDGSS